ncbi:hypothetical protein EI555_000492, partial [Monodon monoceros]
NIPDAAFIQATYRKRELARAQEDYISLDVKHAFTISGMKKNTEYPETTRNEETSEDSEEDKKYQDIWEQQQMRRAVKIT